MKTINKKETVLFKLLSYYFNEEDDKMKSSRELAEMFGTTRTRVNTAMWLLVEHKYVLPSKNACWGINKARQSFKNLKLDRTIEGDDYVFKCDFIYVSLNRNCMETMMKKYEITFEELTDFTVLTFLTAVILSENKTSILSVLKSENGKMWIKKMGYSRVYEKPVVSTGFTKGEPTLGF